MYVKGEVLYSYDCFAYEETWTENRNGTKTPAKKSHYYYAIPGEGDTIFGLEVGVNEKNDMDELSNQTYDYIYGGAEPTAVITVEGRMSKMDDEMQGYFKEYLQEMGYTNQEIAAMGDFFYVKKASMKNVRIMFSVGVGLILLGIIIFIIRFKKNGLSVGNKEQQQVQNSENYQNGQNYQNDESFQPYDPYQNNENNQGGEMNQNERQE